MGAMMAEEKKGFFRRLKEGLFKTHQGLVSKIDQLVAGKKKIDEDLLTELEEILITSDIGVKTTQELLGHVSAMVQRKELEDADLLKKNLQEQMFQILKQQEKPLNLSAARPLVIMVIGVNGTGKTTTIGKLAQKFKAQGKSVLLVAADTFRAAAIEQLEIWGQRVGCEVIKHKSGSDPSAVVFDSLKAAKSRGTDILLVDTAGRLHTKINLMEELKKIRRIMDREISGAPHEVLLVLDATTGQNAIAQAKMFKQAVGVTGIVLTKLDGTAKGGILIGISAELKIPLRYIGIGEKVDDLREFNARDFVDALF
jgi:fused signal recognition particle receptor